MTRDIVNSTKHYRSTNKTYDLVKGTVQNWRDGNNWAITRYRYRDDAISTLPYPGGGYHAPTSYKTFKYEMDSSNNTDDVYYRWGYDNSCQHLAHNSVTKTTNYPPVYLLGRGFGTHLLLPYSIIPAIPPTLEAQVMDSLNKLVQQNGWALSQTMGELPETVALLLLVCRRLARSIYLFRKGFLKESLEAISEDVVGNLKTVSRKAKPTPFRDGASLILEIQYGWKPLMNDIYELANAVENGFKQPISLPITVRKEQPFDLSETFSDGMKIFSRTGKGKYVAKAGIKAYVTNEALAQLGSHGLTNPAALAWELFPLSFVINWFIPIGNFLSGISTHIGYEFRDGYYTKYVEWESELSGKSPISEPFCSGKYRRQYGAGAAGWLHDFKYSHRESLVCFERQFLPFPPPPVPYWNPDLNLSKVESIVTLLVSFGKY